MRIILLFVQKKGDVMIKKISSKSERFDSLVPGFHDDTGIRRNRPEFREIKEESPKVTLDNMDIHLYERKLSETYQTDLHPVYTF